MLPYSCRAVLLVYEMLDSADKLGWAVREASKPGRGTAESWVLHGSDEGRARHVEPDPHRVIADLSELEVQDSLGSDEMSELTEDEAISYGAWVGALIGVGAGGEAALEEIAGNGLEAGQQMGVGRAAQVLQFDHGALARFLHVRPLLPGLGA